MSLFLNGRVVVLYVEVCLSYLKVQKIISKGCMYNLVRVRDSTFKVPSLESVLIVNEFLDVFL